MKYELDGGNLPVVTVNLDRGEQVFTETGGMAWMSDRIRMETNMEGGLFGGLTRAFSGESLFMVTYTAEADQQHAAFTSSFPGVILPLEITPGRTIICQKHSFLAAERSVNLEAHFHRRLGAGLFGGEGFVLQRLSGNGTAFVEIDGAVVEQVLDPGQVLKVDPGHIAAFDSGVDFSLDSVKGFKNILFGGEGLFLATLRGPGKVWLQTMPVANLVQTLLPMWPKAKKS